MATPTAAAVVTTKSLTGLDIGIIAVYFVIIFGIGVYFARKGRNSVDYFLAGRNVGWFAIGASLFVSNISTEHFIGLAGSGATSGLAVGHFEWLACLILLILGTTVAVHPMAVTDAALFWEIPVMVLFTLLLIPALANGLRVHRWEGLILLAAYAGFVTWQVTRAGG